MASPSPFFRLRRDLLLSGLGQDVEHWPRGPGLPVMVRALVGFPGETQEQTNEEGRLGRQRVSHNVRTFEFPAPALAAAFPELAAIEDPRRGDELIWLGERWRLDSRPEYHRTGGTWIGEAHYVGDGVP
jgi:hypothetical protein